MKSTIPFFIKRPYWLILSAASLQAAVLQGQIIDAESRRPLTGVQVEWSASAGRKVLTDPQGYFRIADAKSGQGELRVAFLGYAEMKSPLDLAETGAQGLVLELRSGLQDLGAARVLGQAQGQVRALNDQRNADGIKNVVASEQIGRFPDQNAAEAIGRVPGVSVARDQGEGRYVLIRGTQPRMSSVKINGQEVPSPEGDGRAVALDVIPSSQVGSIEVNKTLLPEMDGDAIGGQVDLQTRKAKSATPEFGASLAGAYNQEMESFRNFEGSATYGQRFGALGVTAGASFSTRHQGSDNIETSYGDMPIYVHADSVDAEGELLETDESVEGVESMELRDYEITRQRASVNLGLDYDLGGGSSLWMSGWYNHFSDQEYRRRLSLRFDKGEIFAADPTVSTGVEVFRDLKDRYEEQDIWSVAAGGAHVFGLSKLDYTASYSHAGENTPDRQETSYGSKVDATVITKITDFPKVGIVDGDAQANGDFEFDEAVTGDDWTTDQNIIAALNYEFPVWSPLGLSAKTGAKARFKSKERNNQDWTFSALEEDENGNELDLPTLDNVQGSFQDEDFLDGKYKNLLGLFPDPDKARDLLNNNGNLFERDADLVENKLGDYEAEEQVYAGYLQFRFSRGPWLAIGGARVEQTRLDLTGRSVDMDEESWDKVQDKNSYTHVLPGLNMRYALTPRTQVRAASWLSISRPDYYNLVPYLTQEDDEVEMGNPDLDASEATNFDVMVEHYFGGLGVVSAGYFFKWIEKDIYTATRELDELSVTMPLNGDWAQIHGLELNYNQQLIFLPGILQSLGLYSNYTFGWSEASVPGRSDVVRMPGQAKHSANLALSFERWGFSSRVSYNIHGSYLSEVGEDADSDIWYDTRTQLDLSLSQELFEGFFLFAEFTNLLDQPLRYYQGDEDHPVQQEFYGITSVAGIKYSF